MSIPVHQSLVQRQSQFVQVLKTFPLSARERNCFHRGSIRFNQQAYFGMNRICIFGQAVKASLTSRLTWMLRLSSIKQITRVPGTTCK